MNSNVLIFGAVAVVVVVGLVYLARKGERTPCNYEGEQARRDAARAKASAKK